MINQAFLLVSVFSTSASTSDGMVVALMIYPSTPSFLARAISSEAPWLVSMMIEAFGAMRAARMEETRSKPSVPGMTMSMSTASGAKPPLRRAAAAAAESAVLTS